MNDPLELAHTLLREPDNASALFELIVWLRSNRDDPAHQAEADAVEDFAYSRTPECAKHKETDKKKLLLKPIATAQATSAGS
ncbi:MAG: hypothetical protein AABN95_07955 [Acidobacteriota bacterium]